MKQKSLLLLIFIIMTVLLIVNINSAKEDQKLIVQKNQIYYSIDNLIKNQRYDDAISSAKWLLVNDKYKYIHLQNLGNIYALKNEWKKALNNYTKAIKNNPYLVQNSRFLLNYSKILYNNKNYDSAIEVLKKLKEMPLQNQIKKEVNTLLKISIKLSREEV